jgi:prolipoprotein diacylglyceryl transferase
LADNRRFFGRPVISRFVIIRILHSAPSRYLKGLERRAFDLWCSFWGSGYGIIFSRFSQGCPWQPRGILVLLDWLAPSVLLGQIIGRFGNLFNYEAFGYPAGLPWKMFVPEQFRPQELMSYQFFHPLFLYEALGNAIILFTLLKLGKKLPSGRLFICYLLLYNMLKFI